MKAKSFSKGKDWKQTWLQTALSIVALAFTVLVSFGVLTPEQMTEAQPLVNSTLGGVAAVIAGVSALIGIFAKQDEPVV
jgi:6,7-dimethyl-8-ribityllumazine synthase